MQTVAASLPGELSPGTIERMKAATLDNLGGNYMIFKRVSYADSDFFANHGFVGWPPVDGFTNTRRWTAECRCTNCGEKYYLGWHSEPSQDSRSTRVPGVLMQKGPDDTVLPGVVDFESDFADKYADGEQITCPDCYKNVTLRHYSHFRAYSGDMRKTYQVMWGTVHNVGNLTALVFWLVTRTITADADVTFTVLPQAAVVIGDKFRYFLHKDGEGWTERKRIADPCQRFYYSAEAAFYKKVGAFFDKKNIPPQAGMSGEKTGLADYLEWGGTFPLLYLKFWREYPAIENLVKTGWALTVENALSLEVYDALRMGERVSFPQALQDLCDWNETSPAKMLGMTKREVREMSIWHWDAETLMLWLDGVASGAFRPGCVSAFYEDVSRFGVEILRQWLELRAQGDKIPFDKLKRYLEKQGKRFLTSQLNQYPEKLEERFRLAFLNAFRLFVDYRKMLRQINDATGTPADNVELFPKDLRAAHDRAAQQVNALKASIEAKKFLDVRETWKDLEFSDGVICARLPASEADLIAEGRTLHICIGSYGNQHVSGKLIIFIRHARRPERSWYALNVDVTGREPRRIQLHGYCNECVHANGKFLRIPQKVLDFCAKWEKNILAPTFRAVRAARKAAQ